MLTFRCRYNIIYLASGKDEEKIAATRGVAQLG